MNFILYSDINERSIGHNLGRPEYSYYFVLKAYRPILESLGQVHLVQSTDEVDPLYRQLHEQGEDCLFLSFTPPHKAARGLQCPMLCVVAWEFESIPDVAWDGDPAQDWSQVLAGHGAAITLSEQTARAVRRVLGEDFPVLALPTPIWEDFAAIRQQGERNPVKSGETLQLKGCVIDSRLLGLSADGLIAPIREETEDEILEVLPETPAEPEPEPVPEPEPEPEPVPLDWRRRLVISKHYLLLWYREAVSDLVPIPVRRWLFRHLRRPLPPPPTALETLPEPLPQAIEPIPPAEPEHPPALLPDVDQHQQVVVDGVVYVSVFNPLDGRKNWHHLITAFCWAFRDTSDATLVLKMTQSDLTTYHVELLTLLSQLSPFACRVIALHGYLDAAEYARLYGAASYYVNASRCEGLCLPLMEFMSCGTPAIAPDHSAMADYMDAQVGFVVRSSQEPAAWPQDSRRLYSTRRYRPSLGVPEGGLPGELPGSPGTAGALSATVRRGQPTHARLLRRRRGPPAPGTLPFRPQGNPCARRRTGGHRHRQRSMLIIIHSETNKTTIRQNLGRPEYSYYFVLKEFRPLLEEIGQVVEVSDPDELVDRLYHDCRKRGEPCVFLSFSPPHRTPIHHACPTIPVFAWEFSTLPSETWHGEPRHDWRHVLRHSGRAITHSSFTVDVVRAAMGRDYPVLSVPAPVWDRFANRASQQAGRPEARDVRLHLDGLLVDSRQLDLADHADPEPSAEVLALPDRAAKQVELSLDGVIYTSVFNPYDGRKNWQDMISAFCATFRDEPDATLVLKLTHHNVGEALADMLHHLYKNQSYRCRIVLIHGYLADPDYERLVEATSYVVNTSYGEGQCLPLMEFMSSGKPAVAPRNTAMIDYIDADNAFIVDSSEEATAWPHDPRAAYRTLRYITDWESLCRAYRASFEVARQEPERYARMSAHASASLERFCSRKLAVERLRRFLDEAAQGDPAALQSIPA